MPVANQQPGEILKEGLTGDLLIHLHHGNHGVVGLPLRQEQSPPMVGGGGFQLRENFIPRLLERFHRRRVGGRQLPQLGCMVPLQVGELRPLPLDSAV